MRNRIFSAFLEKLTRVILLPATSKVPPMEESHFIEKSRAILAQVQGKPLSVEERREHAIELAGLMLNESRRIQTYAEQQAQDFLAKMMEDPVGKSFTMTVTDQCFRSCSNRRVADQLKSILKQFGVPRFLPMDKRIKLSAFKMMGSGIGQVLAPLAKRMIRHQAQRVILPGERAKIKKHLEERYREGVRVNLNHLGEAILGEEEAERRLQVYLDDLSKPEVEYISVKASTICSQLNLLAREDTLELLAARFRLLLRAAFKDQFVRPNGKRVAKFVNLDMEEYRDLQLTIALFKKVLDEPEFFRTSAGIVLQSYLPDAYILQQELTLWAIQRVASGGAPIKVRLVKGANLAMEKVESSLKSWPLATYSHKVDVDANFKRMLDYACQSEHARAAHIGVGSHNLFDIAYAFLLRAENNVEEFVEFEMLEGMADHMRRVVQGLSHGMLLYCPVAAKEEFQHAVAYLVRRLDENTAPENFLRHAFDLLPGTREWQQQVSLFSISCHAANSVSLKPKRTQNRLLSVEQPASDSPFAHEADTDWALLNNGKWALEIVHNWGHRDYPDIPAVIAGQEILEPKRPVIDPSRPMETLCKYTIVDEVETAISCAKEQEESWGETLISERVEILKKVAQGLRRARSDLIGAMLAGTGKCIPEGDAEVSEAIDFVEYYLREAANLKWKPKGSVLTLTPWNFPIAIPTGMISAALLAGNAVIFKPSEEAVLPAWHLVRIFWEAGVPMEALQFVLCDEEPQGSQLVSDPRIDAVYLTGGTETAEKFLRMRPGMELYAETGGKNAMVVAALSDRDLAIRDILTSSFGHAGQKCSACSLVILEAEVYDDRHFLEHLRDAVASLRVGSTWHLSSKINPLITPPKEKLLKGLTELEEGEKWLLQPKQDADNPHLWSPGIKLGVKLGSFTHQTELFGPVLGLMRASNIAEAIELANATPYGLTAGLHSLDEREHMQWLESIEAGNCYINRGMTGAIVQRQPFGGCKASNFGCGFKAGGPNYLYQFVNLKEIEMAVEEEQIHASLSSINCLMEEQLTGDALDLARRSILSYSHYWNHYFKEDHDLSKIRGQDNILRYLPRKNIIYRHQEGDELVDALRIMAAASVCGCPLEISCNPGSFTKPIPNLNVIEESEEAFCLRLRELPKRRIRLIGTPSDSLKDGLSQSLSSLCQVPTLSFGRIELLHYLREVNISYDYHRYGNLGTREVD